MSSLPTSSPEQKLWDQVWKCFTWDPESRPEILLTRLSADEVETVYRRLLMASEVSPPGVNLAWIPETEQDVPLESIEHLGRAIAEGLVAPPRATFRGLKHDEERLPDFGATFYEDQVALDYHPGPSWTPNLVGVLAQFLRNLVAGISAVDLAWTPDGATDTTVVPQFSGAVLTYWADTDPGRGAIRTTAGSRGLRIEDCISLLRSRGVTLRAGMKPHDLEKVERRFGFEFGPDHRELLLRAVPAGESWVDWLLDPKRDLRRRLAGPVEGVLYDVKRNGFWPASWGRRPADESEMLRHARAQLESWPVLVPIYAHRYMPAMPVASGAPVFSVYQTDIVQYGSDLQNYFQNEFGARGFETRDAQVDVPPWSLLAAGEQDADL